MLSLTALSFTAPGRAATGWIADLAGIGDEPTLEQDGSVPGAAIVLESGVLPNGAEYEFVAKKVTNESLSGPGGPPGGRNAHIPTMICFQVDWPSLLNKGRGGACTDSPYTGERDDPGLESTLFVRAPGSPRISPGIFFGLADDSRVTRVQVAQVTADGKHTPLASSTITLDGAALRQLDAEHPVSVFFAVLGSDEVRAAAGREAQVTASAFDATGRELASSDAFAPLSCPKHPPDLEKTSDPNGTPVPASPAEIERMNRTVECQAGP